MALRIGRTEKFIRYLEKLERGTKKGPDFYMGDWCRINRKKETVKEAAKSMCGTEGCAAGHIVFLFAPKGWKVKAEYVDGGPADLFDEKGKQISWSDEAQKMLGMSDSEASIFYRTGAELPEIIEEFKLMVKRAKRKRVMKK